MRKLIALVIFFLFACNLKPAFAQSEDWTIPSFNSKIDLLLTGKVRVEETITTQFNIQKHGIYRDIPYEYHDPTGPILYTNVNIQSVTQDGENAQKTVTAENGYIRIRIGDPDHTITGPHTYVITYLATGVLRPFPDHDELYWNVTGNGWDAPIKNATATITLPQGRVLEIRCFEGYIEDSTGCAVKEPRPEQAIFSTQQTLSPGQGMTVYVGYTKNVIPILTGTPPKRLESDILTPISIIVFLITFALGLMSILRLWFLRGRDFWFRAPSVLDPDAKAETRPLVAHETTVVEFEPPEKLRPAEIGVLMDERADTLDVTGTLIDLATRGYLKITETPKKWVFGSTDYILEQIKDPDPLLLTYEKMLLDRLFSGTKTTKMSDLKLQFYKDLAEIKTALYAEVTDKKLFAGNPEKVRQKYLIIGAIGIVVGVICIFLAGSFILGPLATCGAAIIISGIILLIASRFMPQRTAKGHELWLRAKGYKEFIGGAEKYRQQFFEKKNMFNEILPYAIVFKLTDKFAKAMKDMGLEPDHPSWYAGNQPFSTAYFVSSVDNFSSSMSRAIASAPSSSGSSGSSGGGFGGGGGGSW